MNTIILNRMYAGKYVTEETNIGHEIINLFKTDNNENYIYLQAYGTFDKKRINDNFNMLLVRGIGQNVFEVIGKAEGLQKCPVFLSKEENKRKLSKEENAHLIHNKQVEYIEKNKIMYGGVFLNELFDNNRDDQDAIYCTFKASSVKLPIKNFYITSDETKIVNNECYYIPTNNGEFAKQSLKMYFTEKDNSYGYAELKNILENEELWEKENNTEKLSNKLLLSGQNITFLDIIKKNDDELAFSNLIFHYLSKNKLLLQRFIEEILGENVDFNENISLHREKYHIDLLIETEKFSFIIENKIKSKINGFKIDETTKETITQIDTYFNKIRNENIKESKDRKIRMYIFLPKYNRIDLRTYKEKIEIKVVFYSDLYDFFKKYAFGIDGYNCTDEYYMDFVRALGKHSKDYDNNLNEIMRDRFVRAIMIKNQK